MSTGSALLQAATSGDVNGLKRILGTVSGYQDVGNEKGETPLLLALKHRKSEAAQFLISKGASATRAASYNKFTPLHYAARNGDVRAMGSLIASLGNPRADLSLQSNRGDTPLHLAAHAGNPGVIKQLVTAGGNVNSKNDSGDTPLIMAARQGRLQNVQALLSHGANSAVRGSSNRSAHDWATVCGFSDVAEAIVSSQFRGPTGQRASTQPAKTVVHQERKLQSSPPPVSAANAKPAVNTVLDTPAVSARKALTRESFLQLVKAGETGYPVNWHIPHSAVHRAKLTFSRPKDQGLGALVLAPPAGDRKVIIQVTNIRHVLAGLAKERAEVLGAASVRGVEGRRFVSLLVDSVDGKQVYFDLALQSADHQAQLVSLLYQALAVYGSAGGVAALKSQRDVQPATRAVSVDTKSQSSAPPPAVTKSPIHSGRPGQAAVSALKSGFPVRLVAGGGAGGGVSVVDSFLHHSPSGGGLGSLFISSSARRQEEPGRGLPLSNLAEVWRGKKDATFSSPQARGFGEHNCLTFVTLQQMAVNVVFQRAEDRTAAVHAIAEICSQSGKNVHH